MTEINRQHWKRIKNNEGIPSLLVPVALTEDYDGCFGNTDEAMRIVENVAAENTHLTVREIRAARAKVEAALLPFSAVEFINRELREAGEGQTWEGDMRPDILERAARSHHRERLLTPGAEKVFTVASKHGMPEIVVTHGAVAEPKGPIQEEAATEWQTIKVKMTPALQDKPLVVTHHSSKIIEFEEWYDPALQAFRLPVDAQQHPDEPLYARSLIHIDDKISAFSGLGRRKLGIYAIHYLPERDEDIRETQIKGTLPEGVPVARGMGEVAQRLIDLYDRVA